MKMKTRLARLRDSHTAGHYFTDRPGEKDVYLPPNIWGTATSRTYGKQTILLG